MPSPLRSISVTVQEPAAGRFRWVLMEQIEGQWVELDATDRPSRSYSSAMADGLLALQALVEDLEQGPREAKAVPPPSPSSPKRPFGFGTLK